jgi:hypothetical protein
VLLIAPNIQEPGQVEAAWELQRSGLQVYPLTGAVTERQIGEQCQPGRFDAIVWLTHGTTQGVMLRPETGGMAGEPALWLPPESVAAYVRAAEVRLVVLLTCKGRQLSREIYFRTGAMVVYAEAELAVATAYTMVNSFARRLATGALDDALEIADTLGLSFYPQRVREDGKLLDFLQQMTAMLTQRMDRMDERQTEENREVNRRLGAVEEKLDGLAAVSLTYSPMRRAMWMLGALLFATPFIINMVVINETHDLAWWRYLPATVVTLGLAVLMLAWGLGWLRR